MQQAFLFQDGGSHLHFGTFCELFNLGLECAECALSYDYMSSWLHVFFCMSRFHRPEVLAVSHPLCSASGCAFFLSCLTQRAGEVEVILEEQDFPRSSFRRKKFKEALRDFDVSRTGGQ